MIRTKTGCVTCRVRRVKCDEGKPHCKNCSRTGRTCDGYWPHRMALPRRDGAQTKSKTTSNRDGKKALVIRPAVVSLSPKVFESDHEVYNFDLFRSHSIPQTNRLVDSSFWSHTVLQIAHTEPAVKHSLLFLGALQSNSKVSRSDVANAFQNYLSALSAAQHLVKSASVTGDYTKVLVCAVLFHCVETILGNHVAARTHLRGGLQLLYERKLIKNDFNDSIVSTYRRLDFQAMTFSDSTAPYELDPRTPMRLKIIDMPSHFSSLNHAANVLMESVYWMFYIDEFYLSRLRLSSSDFTAYTSELKRCRSFFELWHERFEQFKNTHGSHLTEFRQRCTLLTTYYYMGLIRAGHDRTLPETHWDASLPDFIRLLDLAEDFTAGDSREFAKGVISFEAGIVIPLFETAMRCRDPCQRRRAVSMLRAAPRKEGIWDSMGAAAVAQCAIEIEEEGLSQVKQAADVPEQQRIYFLVPAANVNKREVYMTFYRQRRILTSEAGLMHYGWTTCDRVVRF